MGLGTNNIILSAVPNFVPQLWSDEVVASYKANIVVRNLVRILNHRGKKGNSIKIPTPTRGAVSSKAASTQVTLIAHGTDTGITVSIDQHKEYSRFIEDIVDVQALASLRRFYTDDAGYAVAKRVDRDLILRAAGGGLTGGTIVEDGTTGNIDSTSTFTNARIGDDSAAWAPTANANAGNAVDMSDLGIRRFVKRLDSVDAPMMGRFLLISPNVKADLLGQARFTEQAFTGESAGSNSIRNGLVGDTYAVQVYVTNQLQQVEDAGATADQDLLLMFQRDGLLLVEQMGIRTQEQYKQEWLANLFTADMIYGTATLRATSIIPIVVPASFTDG
jgi:hypothetical protein